MPSKTEPSDSLFDRLVAREEKRGLILVAFLRICMLAFILLLFSKPDSPTGKLYTLLEVLGWFIPGVFIQLFVAFRGGKTYWMIYLLAVIDAALIVYVSVVPDPLNPLIDHPAWLYGFVVRDRGVVFSMIMMALVIMTFSPRLILWFGFWLFVAWCGAIWWLVTRPGVIVSQHFGDEWNPTQQELIDTYNLPEFVDISALAEQVIIVIVFTLACAVMVSRLRVLINQFAAAERAHGNLARYFPTALADQLADRDEPVRVGERRECVILFADIMGFSRFAEKRDPQEVMRFLNQFHQITTSQIGAYGGIVEKYIGDAVMASFAAFDNLERPAANAFCAAQAIINQVAEWQATDPADGDEPLRIGVGLNFGAAVVGDIGQREAMTSAVIGASVNLAARLEQATRELGSEMVISADFANKLRNEVPVCAPVLLAPYSQTETIQVKGFSEPVGVLFRPAEQG
ncbi:MULTISPECIES: adenylate/guanylate cyclase domain-containing protein [Thalassospira]|uniref:Adenylate/guanylate cyclase domain-containing protein n=1 Tax=Thalassospira povalilytica TaxID=732237 RepID=A0A8I1SH19_9PROT|nr:MULTISPECIES: adenylate/guanylate cyclase domain-containing protein [Thalassospira]MBN8194963.1 adenylate/guanylate cyclase domain-containing protein [Thalassospira povalilytica]MBO6770681.1 adenylate/guanylate cyclase domain-containing protein [Thalassospira sp.]MCC4240228.1 adenylate/guanylate cyclase domain-containing protein [Thalassospira povalilytica]PKR50222.1 adenylate/guanylate cyclase domain-containing protein [Thalassospira povalilytica]